MRRTLYSTTAALVLFAAPAFGQATGVPSFNAPYRAFDQYEFGGTFTLPNGPPEWSAEGQFRFGYERFDIGARGGVLRTEIGGVSSTDLILGVEARTRVLEHTEGIPVDLAAIVGFGTFEFDSWLVPVGLSIGRRVDLDGFSFVAYTQPTLFMSFNGGSDVNFGLGFGADFRVQEALDLRVSVGILDGPEGLGVSLVWIR